MTQLVKVVSDAELKKNGGRYAVIGDVAYPVIAVQSDKRAIQGAIPVYVTTDFNRFKPSGATPMVVADIDVVGSNVDVIDRNATPVYVISGSLGLPAQPTGLTATQNGNDVDLVWVDNANNNTGYYVYRSSDGVSYTKIATIGDVVLYTDTAPGWGAWYYKVAAYNTLGEILSTAAMVSVTYTNKILGVQNSFIIQGLILGESSGLLAVDSGPLGNNGGLIAASGITYGVPGIDPLETALQLDGNNTYIDMVNIVGNTFPTDWNGNLFSAISWGKVDAAARWTDSSTFRYFWHVRDGSDATYYAVMGKHTDNNTIFWRRRTGGLITEIKYLFVTPPTDWFCMGMAHDQSSLVLAPYLWDSVNGFQALTPVVSANLTDWGNHPPTGGTTVLGAGSLTLQEWVGTMQHGWTWAGAQLSDTEMQTVMTL